ncbi:MAG: IclR family transcriptional regulator [Acidimicrobiales bacterium]
MTDGLLTRATLVMEAVVEAGEPIGPRALARITGIDRSAVGRILQQLDAIDVLVGLDGRYAPGPRLYSIGRTLTALDTLPSAAASALAGLVQSFDETSYVCMLHGDAAVFMYECQSSKPLRYVVELGKPVPLHAGAAGRAILAGLPEDEVKDLLGSAPLAALTDATVCDVDELLALRSDDARRGYAISREERVEGGIAVAAPFFDNMNRCQGSVALTCPVSRFADYAETAVGAAVRGAAETLSARLGANDGGTGRA